MSPWLSLVVVLIAFHALAAVVNGPFIQSLDILARRLKLPGSVAGATLLAFGTSAPEISTALVALFADGAAPAIGVGSIVGSAIFQLLVVVGYAATVRPATLDWRPVVRDCAFYALSIVLLLLCVRDDRFTLGEASVMVGAYLVYLGVMWLWTRSVVEEEGVEVEPAASPSNAPVGLARRLLLVVTLPVDALLRLIPDPRQDERWTLPVFMLSLGIIGFACYELVIAAQVIAEALSVPPAIIALTLLAGGSSIPELVSSATVSRQGRGGMAIANAIGSNTFDVLMSLGFPVLLFCLMHGDLEGLGGATMTSSILVLFVTLVLMLGLLAALRFRVGRAMGASLILLYVVYVVAAYLGWMG